MTKALHTSLGVAASLYILSIGGEPGVRGRPSLFRMLRWLRQLSYTVPVYTHLYHSDVTNTNQRLLISIVLISYT